MHDATVTIANTLFNSNRVFAGDTYSTGGASIYASGEWTTLNIINSTFIGNQVNTAPSDTQPSANIDINGTVDVDIVNSILWGTMDDTAEGLEFNGISVTIANSCVASGDTDNGNIIVDPELDTDYHLTAGSPCRNTGDNATVPLDYVDLDDNGDTDEILPWDLDRLPRIAGELVDMGAFEYQ